ncbi:DNA-processing protein DprA [Marinomonas epiphytica]
MNESPYYSDLSSKDWIALSLLDGIGPARLSRLCTYLESLSEQSDGVLFSSNDQDPTLSFELLLALKWPQVTAKQAMEYLNHGVLSDSQKSKFEDSLKWLQVEGRSLLLRGSDDYPQTLNEIKVAPAMLFVEGTTEALSKPCIGIVGARKCVNENKKLTYEIAGELARSGFTVVSGGAIGIDTQAHYGAMQAGANSTVAVMGTGLSHLYPKSNQGLFQKIINSHGCIVSEYPLSCTPRPHFFPPRNRIISGLSLGVFVAQASLKSGSLISANYAVEQNRDVFALPARVSDEFNAGCLALLKQGAMLTVSAQDILQTYPNLSLAASQQNSDAHSTSHSVASKIQANCFADINLDARPIYDFISNQQGVDFDWLVRKSGHEAGFLMQLLMELELAGLVKNNMGYYYPSKTG